MGDGDWRSLAANYPDKVREVVSRVEGGGPVGSRPDNGAAPEIWILGSGSGSAPLAARLGTSFALSLFHVGAAADPTIITDMYRSNFRPSPIRGGRAQACIAVAGVCAETDAAAQRIASAHTNSLVHLNIIGTPERWRAELTTLCRRFAVDEVVVLELSRHFDDHRRAIEALAEAFALDIALASV